MKMEKIYPNADLKLVDKVMVYADIDGNYLYPNADMNEDEKLDKKTLLDLAFKGLLMVCVDSPLEETTYYREPVEIQVPYELPYIVVNLEGSGSGLGFYSSEYTEED